MNIWPRSSASTILSLCRPAMLSWSPTSRRPATGHYQSIDQGARYQVRRTVLKPGRRLSLQKHFHRAELWIVVRGDADVTLDGVEHPGARERIRSICRSAPIIGWPIPARSISS